jgi:hypothetical protein
MKVTRDNSGYHCRQYPYERGKLIIQTYRPALSHRRCPIAGRYCGGRRNDREKRENAFIGQTAKKAREKEGRKRAKRNFTQRYEWSRDLAIIA